MWLRLRQIALVTDQLAALEATIADVFALEPCHRDPAVAEFGLENVLLPVGHQFLEIVAPVQPGTAAGRYLERRGGPGGYMVITQCDDHAARRARVEGLGVRIAHEFKATGFLNMQLHPRDTGGTFFEIDQQLGASGEAPDGDWLPAGGDWRSAVRTTRISGIAAAEIQCDDPAKVASRWAEIAELPIARNGARFVLELDIGRVVFVPCRDGRPEGLAALELSSEDSDAVLDAVRDRGMAVVDRGFELGGLRWRLMGDRD